VGEAAKGLTSIYPSATYDTEVGFVFNPWDSHACC
jgi:hypothetical protein